MATVTGMTAARMQAIEDESIVNGAIAGGHLILTRHDGTTIDSGSVIGPTGPTGPTGATSIAVVTSSTRPTGGALFTGLMIYETDTKRVYVYDGATWNYRGGLWLCTSSTRPASPFNGLMIYETDTKFVYVYDGTTWNYRGGLFSCTSSTRPASPFQGLEIYETDTKKKYVYDGSAWVKLPSPPLFVRKATTQSVTSNTALQNDNDLVIPLVANTTYHVEMTLYTQVGSGGNLKFQFAALPAGAVMLASVSYYDPTPTFSSVTFDNSAVLVVASSFFLPVVFRGIIRVGGTAGSLQLKWAQNASSATPLVLAIDSYLKLDSLV